MLIVFFFFFFFKILFQEGKQPFSGFKMILQECRKTLVVNNRWYTR